MQAKGVTGNQPVRPRPRIFIGSSSEGLDIARALQAALYNEAEPVIWSQGVFGLSGGTLETLLQESDNFDFAVFILSADDLVVKRGQRGNAARDNVLFELGLFMGRLGRDRTFFVYSRTDQLLMPSDLAGVTAASYLPPSEPRYLLAAISAVSSPILAAVQTLGPRAIGGVRSASFSKELDDLRGQVAEMRIALASFAAYARELPETEGTQKQIAKRDGASDLTVLSGTWIGDPTGSTAWCWKESSKALFIYSYGGDGVPTGEYYDWVRTGNALSGKFRWFEQPDIRGYTWFEIVGDSKLRGGWWMQEDVPNHLISKLPHVPRMVPLEWRKVSASIDPKAKKWIKMRDLDHIRHRKV